MNYIEEFQNFQHSFEALEIQDKFEQFNVFNLINDYNYIEAERMVPDFLRYDLAVFTQRVEAMPAPDSREEAKALFEQLIDETVPCLDPADGDYIVAGDYRNMLHAMVAISIVLAHYYPAYFVPYFYRYKINQLRHTAEECGFELPPVPKENDWRGRCMFYWDLCEVLYDFRIKYNWISLELWIFLFHFAPMCLPAVDYTAPLPAPAHIWWLGKREAIDEYRNITQTHLRMSAHKGDLVVRYEAAPTQGVTTFWRVLTDAEADPLDPLYSDCFIGNKLPTPLLSYQELKADGYFGKHPLCKRRFLNGDGYSLSQEDLQQLLRLLKAKGFDCDL